jgi:outer membrane protein, heavy metal efflux system
MISMENENRFRLLAALALWPLTAFVAFAQGPSVVSEPERVPTPAVQAWASPRSVDSASGMSPDDLVRYALAHNGELAVTRQAIVEARGRLRQAGLKPNPMLEAGGWQTVTSADNNLMVEVEWPLELGGRRKSRESVGLREVEMREAEALDYERRLSAEVRSRYSEAVAAARNLKFGEDLLGLLRSSHGLIKSRVELGKSALLEQNLVLVEMNKADALRIGFESKTEVALLELKKVIGMAPDEPLILSGDFTYERQPPPQSEALRLALETRPDLIALRAAESLAAAQIQQARVEGKTDASVFAGYQRMQSGYEVRGFNDAGALVPVNGVFHSATFGVRLSLPTRNKNQGNIEVAAATAEAARRRREFAEHVVRTEVAAAYARMTLARAAVAIYRDGVRDAAARNLEVLRQAYMLGQRNLLDVISEQRLLIEVETGYTEMLKEQLDASIEIERVTGQPAPPAGK